MRTQYTFIALLLLLFSVESSFANTPEPAAQAAEAKPAAAEEEVLPDAMSRLIKAPDIDIENIRDPFLSSFEKARIEEEKRFKKYKQRPENKRKRDVLESFDLSALTLVGTYKKSGKEWIASVQDPSGKAYTVRRGSYIGKLGGRVEKIDGTTIYVVEQALNPAGDLIDRQVTLTLSEVPKK